ncbi:MAG TPA: DUF4129 domain-containing protein [Kofleriaceae bacterium]
MRGPVAALAALLAIGVAAPAFADRHDGVTDTSDDSDDADTIGSGSNRAEAPAPTASEHPHHRLGYATGTQASADKIDDARHSALDDDYQRELPRPGYAGLGDNDFTFPTSASYPHGRPFGSHDPADDRFPANGQGSGGGHVGPAHAGSGSGATPPVTAGSNGSGGSADPAHSRTAAPQDDRFGGRHRAAGGNLPDDRDDRPEDRDHPHRYRYEGDDERDSGSSFMNWIMWGLLIVGGLLILFWIANELLKTDAEAELAPTERGPDTTAIVDAVIQRPLGDADEFAHHGDYAEAIHTLLLRTLQELARSAAVRIAPANTSREILARVPLLADARDALAGLITTVELTHFGDEPANAADYERCVRQFQVFAAAFRGSLAAGRNAGGGTSRAVPA